jgi:hypothetical protein
MRCLVRAAAKRRNEKRHSVCIHRRRRAQCAATLGSLILATFIPMHAGTTWEPFLYAGMFALGSAGWLVVRRLPLSVIAAGILVLLPGAGLWLQLTLVGDAC